MAVYTEIDDDALISCMGAYDAGDVLSYKGIAEGIEQGRKQGESADGALIISTQEELAQHGGASLGGVEADGAPELGGDGWELVSTLDTNIAQGSSDELVLFLKRPCMDDDLVE